MLKRIDVLANLRSFAYGLLLGFAIFLATVVGFHLQSLLFESKVKSVLRRLQTIQLNRTTKEEALAVLPELKPGILWNFEVEGRPDDRCPGDACYVFRRRNWPDGLLAKLRQRLNYKQNWIFTSAYGFGHRFSGFGAYVEIRGGLVSRYEYSVFVEDVKYPAVEDVSLDVLGADRASFPLGYATVTDYDKIRGLKLEAPNNKPQTILYVAFTPEAPPQIIKAAFDLRLNCMWNLEGCSTTKQLLPNIWQELE